MAYASVDAIKKAVALVNNYDEKEAQKVRDAEQQTDKYEDALGTYLVRLSSQNLSARDTTEAAKLLFLIGEMYDKKMQFSESAKKELGVMMSAFDGNDVLLAAKVDPLEEVIDGLKSTLKKKHIERLQCNKCTIEMGFVFSDLITALERISDHCSNIAGCLIEMSHDSLNMHSYLYKLKHEPSAKYAIDGKMAKE